MGTRRGGRWWCRGAIVALLLGTAGSLVAEEAVLVFPIAEGAELRCDLTALSDRHSVVDCAREAARTATWPGCDADAECTARRILRAALDGVRADGALGDPVASLVVAACQGDGACAAHPVVEPAVRFALDAAGGFSCAGTTVHAGPAFENVAAAAAAFFGQPIRLGGCSGDDDDDASKPAAVVVVDGDSLRGCDLADAVDRALATLQGGVLMLRGAAPCTGDGPYGGAVWRVAAALKARAAWLDVTLGHFDGGVAFVRRRPSREGLPRPEECPRSFFGGKSFFEGEEALGQSFEEVNPSTVDANGALAALVSQQRDGGASFRGGACGPEAAARLGALWGRARAALVGAAEDSWSAAALLGCPPKAWLRPLLTSHATGTRFLLAKEEAAAAAAARKFVAVNVGANKGYAIAKVLAELAPDLGVDAARWGTSLRRQGARLACGWCRDCLDHRETTTGSAVEAACLSSSSSSSSSSPRVVEIHAVEPLRANVRLIEAALADFGFTQVGDGRWRAASGRVTALVHLHAVAAGARNGTALFPALAAGEEVGALCAGDECEALFEGRFDGEAATFDEIPLRRLDDLLPDLQQTVDILITDVEGFDPLVLAGAPETLRRTALVEFEYHFRGAWATTSLRDVVRDLDARGFDCFLQGPHSALWRLSRDCWHDAFEVRAWSNVLCVARTEVEWAALLEPYVVVDDGFSAPAQG